MGVRNKTAAKYMVDTQVRPRGVQDERVLRAIENVPRDRFVPRHYKKFAYSDCPLPISDGQTISQPYMVAAMTEYLALDDRSKVLEIGTGSGYQTAVLAEIARKVYTVEIVENLAFKARDLLVKMNYRNIHFKLGDGYYGWEEHAPYDGIIVTAAPDNIPHDLQHQLKPGGKLVIPIGPSSSHQNLYVISKDNEGGLSSQTVMAVRFVPLTGAH